MTTHIRSTAAVRTPVLVAGAGVTGALTALELAHHGVPSTVVERSGGPSRFPDLQLVNGRSMELLRRLNLARRLRSDEVDPHRPVDVVLGREKTTVRLLPPATELEMSYAQSADGTAPLEPYLLIKGPDLIARLRQALHAHPLIDLRLRWTLTDMRSEPDGVAATVIDADTGRRHLVESAYLAGCDGTDSTVRRCAGLGLEPFGPPEAHFTVYFRSAALAGGRANPTVLITEDATVITGHDTDMCVAHLPLSADDQAGIGDPAGLLSSRLGLSADPPQIVAVVQRAGAPSIARSYRRDRVFLAGRAAHQPEAPRDDVDTSVGDAIALGWRLAAAIHGWGDDRLLDGYATERRRQAVLDHESDTRTDADRYDPAGTAGHRVPSFRLTGGEELLDRLGPQFTLADDTPGQYGWQLVTAARARGVPIRHLSVAGSPVPAAWPGRLVLIRPDQQVAWSADEPPADCDEVLDKVIGVRHRLYENT